MRALHLFFRLHRPYELKPVDGVETDHFGGEAAFREANRTEYQPFLALLERNTQKYSKFVFSIAISGVWLEQAERWDPELVRRLRKLVNLGRVQLLAEPYYYSLASFYNADEFEAQMALHKKKMEYVFGVECQVLAMPELMYNDKIATWAEKAGFKGVLVGGAERVLRWQSVNQVFEAKNADSLRILCQNSRFSRAIRRAGDLVMIEGVKTSDKFTGDSDDELIEDSQKTLKTRKRATAAEFVKSMNGAARHEVEASAAVARERVSMGRMVFSAKKLQKELDIECLRGSLVNLCLDTGIFSKFRADGIVRFFDELISNWLKVPGNRFLKASEALESMDPTISISVPMTINWRGEDLSQTNGLVPLREAHFCPPEWLRLPVQRQISERIYLMRDEVLATKDEVLQYYFGRLTCLDYLVALNPEVPILVGDDHARRLKTEEAQENLAVFEAILDDFAEQIFSKQPKPAKLAAETDAKIDQMIDETEVKSDEEKAKVEKEDSDDDFAVKVHHGVKSQKSAIKATQNTTKQHRNANSRARETYKQHKEGPIDLTSEEILRELSILQQEIERKSAMRREMVFDESKLQQGIQVETVDEKLAETFDAIEVKKAKKNPSVNSFAKRFAEFSGVKLGVERVKKQTTKTVKSRADTKVTKPEKLASSKVKSEKLKPDRLREKTLEKKTGKVSKKVSEQKAENTSEKIVAPQRQTARMKRMQIIEQNKLAGSKQASYDEMVEIGATTKHFARQEKAEAFTDEIFDYEKAQGMQDVFQDLKRWPNLEQGTAPRVKSKQTNAKKINVTQKMTEKVKSSNKMSRMTEKVMVNKEKMPTRESDKSFGRNETKGVHLRDNNGQNRNDAKLSHKMKEQDIKTQNEVRIDDLGTAAWGGALDEAEEVLEFRETGAGAPVEVAETNATDNAATEAQILAQRLAQKMPSQRNYEDLTEAELVVAPKLGDNKKDTSTKKREFRKLMVE